MKGRKNNMNFSDEWDLKEFIDSIPDDKRSAEFFEAAEKLFDYVSNIPEERYPEMIFKTSFNDFGNDSVDYFKSHDENDPRAVYLSTARKKYKNIHEYYDMLDLWYEYVYDVARSQGIPEMLVESMVESGSITENVPTKPGLKMTKENKIHLRNGTVPPRIDEEMARVQMAAYMERRAEERAAMTEEDFIGISDYAIDINDLPKEERKIVKKMWKKMDQKSRLHQLKTGVKIGEDRSSLLTQNFDIISSFYGNNISSGDREALRNERLFAEEGKIDWDYELKKAEEAKWRVGIRYEHEDYGNSTTWNGSRFIKKARKNKEAIYRELILGGVNPELLGMKESMSKKEIKLIQREVNAMQPGTKDEFENFNERGMKRDKKSSKKNKKKNKKIAKLASNKYDRDNQLSSILRDSGMGDVLDDNLESIFGAYGYDMENSLYDD